MCKRSQYFPNSYKLFAGDSNVEISLSNYVTKIDLKNETVINTSKLASTSNLVSLKAKVDKSDVDNLVPVLQNLRKLSNVVNNEVVKKSVYDKLVTKVNNIDANEFVLKTKYDTDKLDLKKKIIDADKNIPDTSSRLVKKQDIMLRLLK